MNRRPILPEIRACVECYHGLHDGEAFALWCGSLCRPPKVVRARRQIVHLSLDMTDHGLIDIARHFLPHTVSHSSVKTLRRCSCDQAGRDAAYRLELEQISAMVAWLCERTWRESPRDRANAARAAIDSTLFVRSPT